MDQSSISPDVEIPLSFDEAALMRTKLYAWLEVLYLRRKVVVQQHGAAAHMIKIYGGFWYHSALNSLMLGVFSHHQQESTLRTLPYLIGFAA